MNFNRLLNELSSLVINSIIKLVIYQIKKEETMKKSFIIVWMIVFLFALAACGETTTDPKAITYTVTFDVQGGSAVQSIEVNEGATITLSSYTTSKDAFDFEGWALSATGTVLSGTYTVNNNVTMFAIFTAQAVEYEITFYDEDGEILDTISFTENSIPTYNYQPVDTEEWDYTFEGWKTSLESNAVLTTLPAVSADTLYYASVSAVKKQYTITFVTNGGTDVGAITVDYGTEVQQPENPSKEGFKFVSWTSDRALQNTISWPINVTTNTTVYAAWNEKIELGIYLQALLSSYTYDVSDFIPEKMQPGGVLADKSQSTIEYSSFVNISSIPTGYGEQWQMVIDNIGQTKSFIDILNVVDSISVTAVTLFNNYIDSNPSDTNNFNFSSGIYEVSIKFEDDVMYLVVDFTTNFPIFGMQTAQIMLKYNISNQEKEGRIQIGDANALRYVITEDSYTFGIRYLGIRRAYFNIQRNEDGDIEGSIFEFLGIDGSISTSSAAQFYITDEYTSVVGNKASGIIGFTSTINELYNTPTGKFLGYEIRESVSSITYNTLWFNLSDQTGITSIKKVDQANGSNPDSIYVNGNASLFGSKNVGGFSLKNLSRRYDIEFRKQYIYYIDNGVLMKAEIEVPMLFVQAEQYNTLVSDVKERNSYLSTFNITLSAATKTKIEADYSTMIDIFIDNKETIKVDDVLYYIGQKYSFSQS